MLHKLHATIFYHYVSSWGHALLGHPLLSVRGPEKAEQFGIWGNVPVLGVCLHPDRPHIPFLFVNADLVIRVCPKIPHSIGASSFSPSMIIIWGVPSGKLT